ncbi:MAG: Na+/solute symporter [Bacteroidetes bacterium]|nr:MAG: Na+/solute symporter [Bacteroidota bacterium]
MLLGFVVGYLILNLLAGLYASRRVKKSDDFILAGRKLPLLLATTTVFATWFGSETVMGASAEMAEHGLRGVIEDPFGASLCLLLVGVFFARKLYRMNLLTFGDFYKICFGRKAELFAGISLVVSYIGWIAAQMVAMGLVIHTFLPEINIQLAIIVSSLCVVGYTWLGGLWAVSITDFVQTVLIIVGLIIVLIIVSDAAGGIGHVIEQTPASYFRFFPDNDWTSWVGWFAAWITIGLGSIPQQDVFQRVMASDSEKTAVRSSLIAAGMYLTVAMIPLLLALCARQLIAAPGDSQLLLTELIRQKTGLWVQVLFFGALLSAIMSTASGALLAPSVILSENIVRPFLKIKNDRALLRLTRFCIIIVACIALAMALVRKDIYELVGEASEISLVSLFVPLCAGLFLKSRNEKAALVSMFSGFAGWIIARFFETEFPPMLIGTGASLAGMILFSVLCRRSAASDN